MHIKQDFIGMAGLCGEHGAHWQLPAYVLAMSASAAAQIGSLFSLFLPMS